VTPAEKVHAETGGRQRRKEKSAILALLQAAQLGAADLDEIDQVIHERQSALATRRRSTPEVPDDAASTARRLGTGTIEAKMISNGHSVRLFGPYLYARFMEGGRYRSRYVGKASDGSTTK
jgi:hypothetical protein